MGYGKARIHLKTTVPPGWSLVGAMPHAMFRLERAKLHRNEYLKLATCEGQLVPFDDAKHDLRSPCGTTLTLGNFVALNVLNVSTEPQPLEMQIAGTVVDADALPTPAPGEPAPELSHNTVLGLFAQEATVERYPMALIPTKELLDTVKSHHEGAIRAVEIAFEQACLRGTSAAFFAMREAEDHADRLLRLVGRCEARLREAPDTLQPDGLGFTPEQYEDMLTQIAARRGTTVDEVRAELIELSSHPEAREPLVPLVTEPVFTDS